MTRSEWVTIGKMLGAQRAAIGASWPPTEPVANAQFAHDRKLIYFAQLEACDKIAVTLAAALDRICASFDRHHFMRLASGS